MPKLKLTVLTILFAFTTCSDIDKSEAELSTYLKEIEQIPAIPLIGDYVVLHKSVPNVIPKDENSNDDIFDNCAKFLAERELRIKLPNSEARDLLEGARSKKLRRVILPLLLLLKLKAAIVLPIILSVIALVSFKGFGLGLAALAVAGTTALKNILEHVGHKVSYEVVPSSVGHWNRAGAVENPIVAAYQQYERV